MIFDVEGDGLWPTKIHVMSYQKDGEKVKSTTNYDEMRSLLLNAKKLIGHNITLYDIPHLERILQIKIQARLIDTLFLSWYLNHKRIIHGLDSYGEEFGIPKPKVDDWHNLSVEEYTHRCEEDVKINKRLWESLRKKLLKVYDNKADANRLLRYLEFKADCIREQHRSKWKFDKVKAELLLADLSDQAETRIEVLRKAMPKVPKYDTRTKPKKPFKQDGTYSVVGAKWFKLLKDHNLPEDYNGEVKVLVSEEEPKPSSPIQVKDWLFSLGWEPRSFKYSKNSKGEENKIPQVRVDGEDGKELCPSVKELIKDNPIIEELEGLTVLQHRISILKGFLENEEDGWLIADVGGLTNTLRFKHRVLVNLPGVDKPFGADIRGCLIADDGHVLCGSDMCSLEENTKKHYMYDYDPEYVIEMSKPGFDAHLDLAVQAGKTTQQEVDDWKEKKPNAIELTPLRKKFKPVNYGCVYGVQAPRLARDNGWSKSEAQELIDVYWQRNWAVKEVEKNVYVKKVDGEMWLWNPVARLYYSLRFEKDKFSTLNQGTGVFCFDSWIREFRKVRSQLTGQFHDEIILSIKKGAEEKCTALLKEAIQRVNDKLKLNVVLDVDVQFGKTYADIH